jgi:hypothetical protein
MHVFLQTPGDQSRVSLPKPKSGVEPIVTIPGRPCRKLLEAVLRAHRVDRYGNG